MVRSLLGFDWHRSQAHLLFLSKFLYPKTTQEFAKLDYWKDVLAEAPDKAIKRFMNEGLLVSPGLPEHLAYRYKVSELQAILKQRSLSVSGRKAELISRLIEADPGGMKSAVAGLTVLECSEHGREIANQYLASEKEKRDATDREALVMLQKGKFKEASLVVAAYEAKQVFPRGIGIDWKNYNPTHTVAILRAIFAGRPKILARLDEGKLGPLRLAAGMMELWGVNKARGWLPPDFETGPVMDNDAAARMLAFYAWHQVRMEEYRKSDFVKSVEVLTANDEHVCEACRNLATKEYKLSEVPELPYEKCTSEMGCRCGVSGVVTIDGTRY